MNSINAARDGWDNIRNLAGLAILLFYIGSMCLIGFFIFGNKGEYVGLGFSLATIFLVLLLGDKLFLVSVGAKEVESKRVDIYERLENIACLNELEGVRLYYSFKIPVNILCIHPLWGRPCIILADEILANSNNEFIEHALSIGLELINKRVLKGMNLFIFIATLILLPKFICDKFGLERVSVLFSFFVLPIAFLKDYIHVSGFESVHSPQDERYLRLAYFLEKFPHQKITIVKSLSDSFSIIKRANYGLWNQLKGSHVVAAEPLVCSEAKE